MASLEINCDISHASQCLLLVWKKIDTSLLSTVVNDLQRLIRTNKTISDVNGASHGSRLEETAE